VETACLVVPAKGAGGDRAAVVRLPDRVVLAAAEGAREIGGVAHAAERMIELITHAATM
jgi:hypothetical protein